MKTKRNAGMLMAATLLLSGATTSVWAADETKAADDAATTSSAAATSDGASQSAATEGTVEGVLTAKGDNWIDVENNDGKTTRYRALWSGGLPKDGGGYDAATLKAIKALRVPNRVRVTWKTSEGPRVLTVAMLEPKDKSGHGYGIVTAVDPKWIEIKSEGIVERYWPRYIGGAPKAGGGLDKDMLGAISERKVGDHVRFEWMYNERKRITVLALDDRKRD